MIDEHIQGDESLSAPGIIRVLKKLLGQVAGNTHPRFKQHAENQLKELSELLKKILKEY